MKWMRYKTDWETPVKLLHYMLTPEKQDLDTFDDSVAQNWARLARVEDLTKDDPAHPATDQATAGAGSPKNCSS